MILSCFLYAIFLLSKVVTVDFLILPTRISFKNLAKRLRSQDIDLDSKLVMGKGKDGFPRPGIFILDKNSGEVALKVRYSVANAGTSKEKIWNPVEMGPLVQRLTTVKYRKND